MIHSAPRDSVCGNSAIGQSLRYRLVFQSVELSARLALAKSTPHVRASGVLLTTPLPPELNTQYRSGAILWGRGLQAGQLVSLPAASPVDRAFRACLGLDTLDSYTAATSIHRDHNSGKHTIRDKAIQWTQVYKPCQAQVIFPFQNSGPQPFLVQNLQNHLHFSLQKTLSSVVLF